MKDSAALPAQTRLADVLGRLPTPEGKRFISVFADEHIEIELYAPEGSDPQQPHDRDELYIVASGTGEYVAGGSRHQVGPGDLLFAPAGAPHRFENFSRPFVVWVLFVAEPLARSAG